MLKYNNCQKLTPIALGLELSPEYRDIVCNMLSLPMKTRYKSIVKYLYLFFTLGVYH